jgi:hypothetical protein
MLCLYLRLRRFGGEVVSLGLRLEIRKFRDSEIGIGGQARSRIHQMRLCRRCRVGIDRESELIRT